VNKSPCPGPRWRACCAGWRRRLSARVVRRYGNFDTAEDPVQEALLAAATQWPKAEGAGRLAAVLHVLYLIFTEGYAATAGPRLHRVELSTEAIRLARMVHKALPKDGEVAGLLALMLPPTPARCPDDR
jgi:predicted RNA polymerase sigma factor